MMPVSKTRSRFITSEMRKNAVLNAEKFDWARARQTEAIEAAVPWLNRSDDELWHMVTAQELPRTVYTNAGLLYGGVAAHCANCGEDAPKKHGKSFWAVDESKRWKTTCLNCGEVYPKNDFGAFYETSLDHHGMFRRKLGDRSLLFNADHSETDDPLRNVYVDDGYGMVDEDGNSHHPIAYYNYERVWRQQVQAGVQILAEAFTLTDDKRYAHKAAVLLDRIADVYPEMDYLPLSKLGFQHSHGGSGEGRIEGCIWETFVVQLFAESYDAIFDGIVEDDALVEFCSSKALEFDLGDKSDTRTVCRHIHENFLLEGLISVKDGRIRGNTGMTHCSLAAAAIALDDPELTPQYLDWLFDPNYPSEKDKNKDPVSWVLTEGLDRDGMGGECGSYGFIWSRYMRELAGILRRYPEYKSHDLIAEYPKLKQAYFIESRINVLDGMVPNIGDSGSVGSWGRGGSAAVYVEAYRIYGDTRFATMAWREHEFQGSNLILKSDIFEEDPEALIQNVRQAADSEEFSLKSVHLGRYGQAHLQTEHSENGRAIFIHYGFGKGHSHHDCLNLGLLAKNVDMMPDLAYPEYTGTWPKRGAWTSNTISHNTLLIGDDRSAYSPGGQIELFAEESPLRVLQVDGRNAYKEADTYRRTIALVDVGEADSYVLDVFRARGGKNHRLSWHGAAGTATVEGLTLSKQEGGTFADPKVIFSTLDGDQGEFYKASGFTYLYDVERTKRPVDHAYTVDWKIEDIHDRVVEGAEPHLRLHALTSCDEVALATGDSPRKLQCPRYVIQSRLGENVQSQYLNVLEPYDRTPFIGQVRELEISGSAGEAGAVAVELTDGRKDILISCEKPTALTVEGGIEFEGLFGFVRLVGDRVTSLRMFGGKRLALGKAELTSEMDAWRGRVTGLDAKNAEDNRVSLDPPLPSDASLVGRTIHFWNDLQIDTSYEIKAVTQEGISTGDITVVRGLDADGERTAYLVNEGDLYTVYAVVGRDPVP
ncbi:MAG: hypothetical protein CME25_10310 [Gemmatimonadetes bacterium]|nr:hypothetical protein [Gemmatimonadota bacterium]